MSLIIYNVETSGDEEFVSKDFLFVYLLWTTRKRKVLKQAKRYATQNRNMLLLSPHMNITKYERMNYEAIKIFKKKNLEKTNALSPHSPSPSTIIFYR